MKPDEIILLYEYNYWADRLILNATGKVSAKQYAAPSNFGNGYVSLRATLVHMLDNIWQWRITCQGFYKTLLTEEEYDATELREAQFPELKDLEDRWLTEQQELRSYIGTLNDAQLNGILRYVFPGGALRERTVWHILFDAFNHGTQHRSEAAAILTSYGQSPGDFDFTLFLNEHYKLPL